MTKITVFGMQGKVIITSRRRKVDRNMGETAFAVSKRA